MDIRIEKTQRAIKNTFLELRAKKPLEKITVKELCALACVNKSTFYSHYEDIFALSELMESETITSVVKNISSQQQDPFQDPEIFTRNLYMALLSNNSLISILFSGREKARLGDCLETEIRKLIQRLQLLHRAHRKGRLHPHEGNLALVQSAVQSVPCSTYETRHREVPGYEPRCDHQNNNAYRQN